jgi:hypothetical protein
MHPVDFAVEVLGDRERILHAERGIGDGKRRRRSRGNTVVPLERTPWYPSSAQNRMTRAVACNLAPVAQWIEQRLCKLDSRWIQGSPPR